MRLFDIFLGDPMPSMASVYVALFFVFLTKGLIAVPLVSLLRDPSGAGVAEAMGDLRILDLGLDAIWLTGAVAAPVLEYNRQWMFTLREAVSKVRYPFWFRTFRWFGPMAICTIGFWAHIKLTRQELVVAWSLLILSFIAMDLNVRSGLIRAMQLYLKVRDRVIDDLKARVEGTRPPRPEPPPAPSIGLVLRWIALTVASGVAGYLALLADALGQLIATTGPVILMMVLGTVIDGVKSSIDSRASADLARMHRD